MLGAPSPHALQAPSFSSLRGPTPQSDPISAINTNDAGAQPNTASPINTNTSPGNFVSVAAIAATSGARYVQSVVVLSVDYSPMLFMLLLTVMMRMSILTHSLLRALSIHILFLCIHASGLI